MGRLVNILLLLALAAGTAHAEIKQQGTPVKIPDLRPLSQDYDKKLRELIVKCPDFWLYDNVSDFHVQDGKCYVASSVPAYDILGR